MAETGGVQAGDREGVCKERLGGPAAVRACALGAGIGVAWAAVRVFICARAYL